MSSPSWALTGNAGTNAATDFIGTTDNQSLVIKTDGVERAVITTEGYVGIGAGTGGAGAGNASLEVVADAPAGGVGPILTLTNSAANAPGNSVAIDLNTWPPVAPAAPLKYNPSCRIEAENGGNYSADLVFLANKPGGANGSLVETLRITPTGVGVGGVGVDGVGAVSPAAALHLVGPSSAPQIASAYNNGLLLGSLGIGDYKWVQSYGGPLALNPVGNDVGIGTSSPRSALEISGGVEGVLGPVITLTNDEVPNNTPVNGIIGSNTGSAVALDLNTYSPSAAGVYNPSSRIEAVDNGNFSNNIVFQANKPGAANGGLVETMRITPAGVGVGEDNPSAALHITGPASAPLSSLTAPDNGLLFGTNGTASYKWIQSYGGPLALNPVGNGVGIGEVSPAAALHITGPSNAPPTLLLGADSGLLLGTNGTASYKWIQSYGGPLALNPVGNGVGIGEDNPSAALHITGPSNAPPANLATADNGLLFGTNGTASYKWIQSYGGPLALNPVGNDVGIGTASPIAPLHLVAPALGNENLPVVLIEADSANNTSPRVGLVDTSQGSNTTAPVWFIDNSQDNFRIFRQPNSSTGGSAWLTINNAGLISVAGDIVLTGADCAEHFDVSGPTAPEPGTVLVIDKEGSLRESCDAYDKKVAGVVSGAGEYRRGILLDGRPSDEPRVALALTGKVYCKVDAQYSPVEVGDLLTTSSTPGHAMKATDAAKAFGAVIGKALRALDGGQGLVPILVSLQ